VTTRESVGGARRRAYIAKNLPPGFEPGLEASSFFEPQNFTFPSARTSAPSSRSRHGQVRSRSTSPSTTAAADQPAAVEGQVQGGIAHSIGQALFEQTVYDENGSC
jgi:carbon-monoxide dehydrogenase large subunit